MAYGLGEPIYLVDHSASARLAPDGAALVHCLYYEPDLAFPKSTIGPGSRRCSTSCSRAGADEVVEARFSRRLVVAHDRPQTPA